MKKHRRCWIYCRKKTDMDKKQLQAHLWVEQNKLTEASKLLERKLLLEVNEIQNILTQLVDIALKEGSNQDALNLSELSKDAVRLFDMWNYASFVAPLRVALAQENVQDSITLLKSLLAAVLTPWEIKKSSLYRHIEVKENQENLGAQMLPKLLLEIESGDECEFLHSNAEFQQLIKEYRTKC